MRITVLGLVAGMLLPWAAVHAGKPKAATPKGGDYIKLEARGTVQRATEAFPPQTEGAFVTPPNPCAAGFLWEKEVERYKFQLGIQPRIIWKAPPPAKATYSLHVRGGGEWELDIDDRFAALFDKQVGKQVTIVGTAKGKRVRVLSVNGLALE